MRLLIHGGAGQWHKWELKVVGSGLQAALDDGWRVLQNGGSAMAAVVAAVVRMEEEAVFNAGYGAAFNQAGKIEMDAAVMTSDGRVGAVAALSGVRHPIQVAQAVMEKTSHVLLSGTGAKAFARQQQFCSYDLKTPWRQKEWRQLRRAAKKSPANQTMSPQRGDTVGAVALDAQGHLAAATSTGGTPFKMPGRIGDAPIPGAGTYAAPMAAVSATGRGELMMCHLTAKTVADWIAQGKSAAEALGLVLDHMASHWGKEVGLIALDRQGGMGIGHLTPWMPHAWIDLYGRGMALSVPAIVQNKILEANG